MPMITADHRTDVVHMVGVVKAILNRLSRYDLGWQILYAYADEVIA